MLAVVDRTTSLIVSGAGDVIEPTDGVIGIGSGGPYALSAAKALLQHSSLDAFRRTVQAFNRAVVEGSEPNASGIDGLRSVQLTDAMARSAREGKVVQLS